MTANRVSALLLPAERVVTHNRHGDRRRDVGVGDLVACAVLCFFAVFDLFRPDSTGVVRHPGPLAVGLTLAMVVPVAFARRFPIGAAAMFAFGGVASWALIGVESRCGATLPAAFWIACVVGLRVVGPRAVLGLGLVLVGICAMGLADANMDLGAALVMMTPIATGFWFGGRIIRQRAETMRLVEAQNEEIVATRDLTARLAVQADRAQIADGLDVLLHERLQGMERTAQVGKGLTDKPEAAQEAFDSIAKEGRETLTHLREVVGTLRESADREPQPGLSWLTTLAAQVGGQVHIVGTPRPLPAGVELSACRIVEQLLRDPSSAPGPEVFVRYAPNELEIRVEMRVQADEPGLPRAEMVAATERTALHGGSLVATRSAGHVQWVARLPIGAEFG